MAAAVSHIPGGLVHRLGQVHGVGDAWLHGGCRGGGVDMTFWLHLLTLEIIYRPLFAGTYIGLSYRPKLRVIIKVSPWHRDAADAVVFGLDTNPWLVRRP